jgi:hypothetical protein
MPTGWTFTAEGGSMGKSYTTPVMAGLDRVQFKIGGWEYSAVTNVAQFDNIQLAPEPATLSLLALGGLVLLRRCRARSA